MEKTKFRVPRQRIAASSGVSRLPVRRVGGLLVVVVAVAFLGLGLLRLSKADTPSVAVEAESATPVQPAATYAANGASGGQAVKFQAGAGGAQGGGTPGGTGGDSGSATPTAPAGYTKLIFDDEFNGTALDLTKWQTCNPAFVAAGDVREAGGQYCKTHYNDEQQLFRMSSPANQNNPNVKVSNGILHLIATKEGGRIYSGMISTGPNIEGYDLPGFKPFGYTHGYFEGRAKFPKGNGFWPSFWMRPVDVNGNGGWPNNGEYDIVEVLGGSHNANLCAPWVDTTKVIFTRFDNSTGANPDTGCFTVADTSLDYHTYGFEWTEGTLKWYFDGKLYRTVNSAAVKNYPFYITANFSLCGNFSGPCDNTTPFPAEYSVDYMRVWQK